MTEFQFLPKTHAFMKQTVLTSLLLFMPVAAALHAEEAGSTNAPQVQKTEFKKGELLFKEDFDGDLSRWVVEQTPSGTTKIIDGKLDVDDGFGPHDKGGCTVWFKEKLSGPILVEYDAVMVKQGGPNDRASDLNCFWMATDPSHPEDFFAGSKERGGNFKKYDDLRLYYVGYGANENVTTRFRRYPRARNDEGLSPQYDLAEAKYMNVPNKVVKVQIVADGDKVQFYRDGERIFDFTDSEPYREGWFGFRTVRNHMTLDNFRVYRLLSQTSNP